LAAGEPTQEQSAKKIFPGAIPKSKGIFGKENKNNNNSL
jgi:hypothetical protein